MTYYQEEMKKVKESFAKYPGKWSEEPFGPIKFVHAGMDCLLLRSHHGVWCGYVRIPEKHKWHGMHYDSIPLEPDCHGGLTYSREQEEGDVRGEGYWIGFDCSQFEDFMPRYHDRSYFSSKESSTCVYRTMEYAKNECEKLAEQVSRNMPLLWRIVFNTLSLFGTV